jgi:hypothetical protein
LDTDRIIQELKLERDRIDSAILALKGHSSERRLSTTTQPRKQSRGRRGPRHMSAEARRRISEAQKKRWAAYKKSGK